MTQTIKGVVVDHAAETPIIAASIMLLGSDPAQGDATDENGQFRITDVPLGRHSLRISCLGYEDAYVHELEVGSGKEVILRIQLSEALTALDEVVVKADRLNGTPNNEMASVSARSFSVEQTKRYAAAVNDPARMALSFAGVNTQDDAGNEIVIRGNSPRGLLWRMEGIEIPSPNHFSDQGASGGGISALSVNMLANSDFLVSAFPAEYGNATSGVFDLRLRNGNNEKREYAFQAGVMGIDAAAEGPIGKGQKASYLANYRYSTLALLENMGVIELSSGITSFQDAAFKVHLPTAGNGYWSVWGMGGLSIDNAKDSLEYYDYFSHRGVLGVNNRTYLPNDAYLETIVSYSVNTQGDEGTYIPTELQTKEAFTSESLRANVLYNRKLDARNTIRVGAIGSRIAYNFEEWEQQGETPRQTLIDELGNTTIWQAYAQWKHRLTPTLHLNAGLHGTLLALDNQATLEPRVGLRWNWKPGHTVSAGAGLHSRMDPLPLYLGRVATGDGTYAQPNRQLELPKAAHGVVGYEWRFHPQWRLQTEVYYQHLYHVPIAAPGVSTPYAPTLSAINIDSGYFVDSLSSDGTGRNYGMELTVERFFVGGWYALATTALYHSTYTPRDGIARSTRYDGRYVASALVGKEWAVGKRSANIIGANIRVNLSGGNRQTPLDLEASRSANQAVYQFDRAWDEQLAGYARADVRVSYRINKRKTSSILSLDIQNATNRENVYGTFYDNSTQGISTELQLGLIPILNYRLEF